MTIKILHIITKLQLGGAQLNTLYTDTNCDKKIFSSAIISGKGGILDSKYGNRILFSNYLSREINFFKELPAFFELRKMIKNVKPDIVHTHSSKAGILGRLAAFSAGVPVIIHTFHGFGFNPHQNFIKRSFFVILEKICASVSDKLIFVSKDNMHLAEKLGIGNPEKRCLIRSGIKLSNYPAKVDPLAKRKELSLPEKSRIIISVGNLKPQKNPDDFLKIAENIIPVTDNSVFLYVGGGNRLDYFQAQVRAKKLENRCMFLGWRNDIGELLAISDIFILTSLWEGLPRSLVEALKSGLVAVCYDTDGIKDILRDNENGFLVKKGDIRAMCHRVKKLLDDDALRKKMAEGANLTELKEFDIRYMLRQLEDLYKLSKS